MRTLPLWIACLGLLFVTRAGIADDSKERQYEKLRGITTVTVKVTDKSKMPGMLAETIVQTQLENLLQNECNLVITPAPTNPPQGWAEVRVELLMIPVPVPQSKTATAVALVRTSVLRPVFLLAADGKSPDTSKTLNLAAWVSTTVSDPNTDPALANAIQGHIGALATMLRGGGPIQPLPNGFSEAFFVSRLPEIHDKLQALFTAKLAAPGVTPSISVDPLTLQDGVLTYKFKGTVTVVGPSLIPVVVHLDDLNPKRQLDLAALATIGALPSGKITLNLPPPLNPTTLSVTVSDLFQ
jgi:hypothetical protein